MKPNGNVLRVVSATSDNAGYIVCEGKTERGLMFAAKGQLKVIGITHHFTYIIVTHFLISYKNIILGCVFLAISSLE